MRLEHVNLVVPSIEDTLKFYRAAFPHWRVRDQGVSVWSGKPRKWLHFGDDYQYLTFNDDGIGDNRNLEGHQPGLAHFAYVTSNISAVIERLTAAGYDIDNNGADETYRRNVYFIDPAGFEVEFVQYLSDIPEQRNHNSA